MMEENAPFCACGCGERVIRGHNGKWNTYLLHHCKKRGNPIRGVNFDTTTYEFRDLDLEMKVMELPSNYKTIVLLYLMGHVQEEIAKRMGCSRSYISIQLTAAKRLLSNALCK